MSQSPRNHPKMKQPETNQSPMSYQFPKSEALFEKAKQVAPGGVHSPVRGFRGVGQAPRFIARGDGAQIFDVDGNAYTDYCMSWGPLIFGHNDPEMREAVTEALSRGWTFGAAEPYSLELAEFITSQLPWVQKIRFVSSGTEAVMSALRVARGATGRSKIVKFDGCYHGHADSMLVRAGSGLAEMASPDSAGVSAAVAAETIVAPLDDLKALENIFEARGSEIAAIIVEPVPANNGLLLPQDSFLPGVCRIARKAGALVIFDEVITGFRVAFGGMAERTGLTPDLVTYGKVIGGGFPVGAYGGRRDLMDLVAPEGPVYQAGTLSANPVAVVAGLTALKKLKRENPYGPLEQRVEAFARDLERRAAGGSVALKIQNFASLFWPVFHSAAEAGSSQAASAASSGGLSAVACADGGLRHFPTVRRIEQIPAGQKQSFARVFHGLLARGIYLPPSGYEVGFLSTAHTSDDLERLAFHFSALVRS